MNEIIIPKENIKDKIYEVRGRLVILDSDLACLYQIETKRVNETVKNNLERFNNDITFILTSEEFDNLRSQISTSRLNNYGGRRYLPRVFTKEGIKIFNSIIRKENKDLIFKKIETNFQIKGNASRLLSPVNTRKIENLIYEVRGVQVMLDQDLAMLYECKNGTKTINLAVKRHPNRFPERYCFRLTEEEISNLRFQFETSSLKKYGGRRYSPYAFTEEGVMMLSSVLKTTVAEQVNLAIMDAFVMMRHYISDSLLEQRHINNLVYKHDEDIKLLQETLKEFKSKEEINTVYFNGEIYDAYSKLVDIMKLAKEELIIIDSYADKTVLDMIKNIQTKVILITKTKSLLNKLDIKKYHEQYHNLNIIYNDTFHDRYLIIDNQTIYHCGTSLNHAGAKHLVLTNYQT